MVKNRFLPHKTTQPETPQAMQFTARRAGRSDRRKRAMKSALCLTLFAFAVCLSINSQRYAAVCLDGLCLWAECVVPSLFPFTVVCLLICGLGGIERVSAPFGGVCKKLNVSPAALPLFLLSAMSGYPTGSKLLSEYRLSGKITESDAQTLAPICSVCSPTFALSTVGYKAFGGAYYGVKLLLTVHIATLLTAVVCKFFSKKSTPTAAKITQRTKNDDLLYDAFYGAVTAVLCAGGFICFFYTLSQAVADLNVLAPLTLVLRPVFGDACNGLALGLIEATGGCFAAARAGGFFALPIAAFLLTFGGASILLQQLFYLKKCNVRQGRFLIIKLAQGLAAFTLCCLA